MIETHRKNFVNMQDSKADDRLLLDDDAYSDAISLSSESRPGTAASRPGTARTVETAKTTDTRYSAASFEEDDSDIEVELRDAAPQRHRLQQADRGDQAQAATKLQAIQRGRQAVRTWRPEGGRCSDNITSDSTRPHWRCSGKRRVRPPGTNAR